MNKLEKLIAKLCPNGVEYRPLGEIASINRGVRVVRAQLTDGGTYPVYQNSIKPLGYHTESNCKANTAFVIAAGAAGEVGYSNVAFWAADDCYYILPQDGLADRFVYYCLMSKQSLLASRVRKASIPRLARQFVESLEIPLPPLPVQEAIVRMLDGMAGLIDALEQELAARKQQYEWYRDKLLKMTNGGGYRKLTLGEVLVSINTGLNPRRFFKLNTHDAGNYYVTIREMHGGRIEISEKTDRINDSALRLCNRRSNLEAGDLLFSGTGTIGEMVVIEETPCNWNIKEGVYAIKPNPKVLEVHYLRYILMEPSIRKAYMLKVSGGTVKSIPMSGMRSIKIPLPPLAEQRRIAARLDAFDKLCNSTTEGLPGEIALRKRQYEFYRDRLLTFKKAG